MGAHRIVLSMTAVISDSAVHLPFDGGTRSDGSTYQDACSIT